MELNNFSSKNVSEKETKEENWDDNEIFFIEKDVLPPESYSLGLYQPEISLIDAFMPSIFDRSCIFPEEQPKLRMFDSMDNLLSFSHLKKKRKPFQIIEIYIRRDDEPVIVSEKSEKSVKTEGTRNNFTNEVREILKDWIIMHADNPYPSSKEILELMSRTHLTRKQVLIWMTNNRSRLLGRSPKNGLTNHPKNMVLLPIPS